MNIKKDFNKLLKLVSRINSNTTIAQLCVVDKMRYDNINPLLHNKIEYRDKLPIQSLDYNRLRTLQLITDEILSKNLPGAIAEVGVYKGFFASKMSSLLPEKNIYLFDTFEGFNTLDVEKEHKEKLVSDDFVQTINNFKKTSVEMVLSNMPHRDKCRVIKGKVPDTFENLEEQFCLVSIDLDFFDATYAALNYFYPRLVPNGYIMLHDYNHDQLFGAKKAIQRFSTLHELKYIPIPDEGGTCVIIK